MWTLFSISLGKNKAEFSVRGVANLGSGTVLFQGLCNGGVFVQYDDYEAVRDVVMNSVELNRENANGLQ